MDPVQLSPFHSLNTGSKDLKQERLSRIEGTQAAKAFGPEIVTNRSSLGVINFALTQRNS
jgi:hypothetical protein